MEPTLAQIILFAGNFAPRGWAFCHGQILPINSNQALFSLLGTTYGGDGRTSFALPDLRGRVPVHQGQGPGLSNHNLGQKYGENYHTLTEAEMPSHHHEVTIAASKAPPTPYPANNLLNYGNLAIYTAPNNTVTMKTNPTSSTGGGQSHNNMMPSLGLNYIIALQGLFPSRN